jgi:hypothetical protein
MNRIRTPVSVSEECVPNIGERGRRRRRRNGVVWLALAIVASGFIVTGRSGDWVLALVFVTSLLAGLGFFQAREKT